MKIRLETKSYYFNLFYLKIFVPLWLPQGTKRPSVPVWTEMNIGLHLEKCCLQVQGDDPSPPFCTGEATSAVLGSVLGFPVWERCGYSEASPAGSQNWLGSWSIFSVRRGWESWDFSLERTGLRGNSCKEITRERDWRGRRHTFPWCSVTGWKAISTR